ncbi:MAG TPA: hypothetical protein ENK88_08515 [Campylobacterales bacterium]|nr:hypothetical protein [Campylobacterales bacterium]HHD80777.1 hypothetical protein [Campylobacterales bacterium]
MIKIHSLSQLGKKQISIQKANMFYNGIENACIELRDIKEGKKDKNSLATLEDLIDELSKKNDLESKTNE